MSLDWIKEPVSADAPAGEDLWENDDAEFGEYYFDAMGRLPEADDYVKLGLQMGGGSDKQPDVIFDPKDVDLKGELAQIDALLKRSRDVRLLTLRAQWCALAANPRALLETLEGMAALLETFPNDCHPSLADGPRDRLDAINDLALVGAMILPLRYLDLGNSGASLRAIRVARGELTAHDGEEDLIASNLLSALTKGGPDVEQAFDQITEIKATVARIETACLTTDAPHTPQLTLLKTELDGILSLMAEANPELAPETGEEAAETAEGGAAADGPAGPGGTVTMQVRPATQVIDHDDARLRLVGVETYFGKHEPSSAAVLLVTQARLLIGKSLIEAFDTLMPDAASRGKMKFVEEFGFTISHASLTRLAGEMRVEDYPEAEPPAPAPTPVVAPDPAPEVMAEAVEDAVTTQESAEGDAAAETEGAEGAAEAAPPEHESEPAPEPTAHPDPAPPAPPPAPDRPAFYRVSNQGEATAQVLAVETYFRAVEKSSPVPVLLSRARAYIGKDFEALMREFLPPGDY
ncbi:MAG: type VI secretion system ImpA family N-terminal domain-containing protein [Pseudomonadota bacterium]